MRLSEFILINLEPILQEWEDFVRSIQPVHRLMDKAALREHAENLLRTIADNLSLQPFPAQPVTCAGDRKIHSARDTPAEVHAETRLDSGFSLEQLVAEYGALRAGVLRRWRLQENDCKPSLFDDMTRFHEAIDQALAESAARYAQKLQEANDIFVGIIGHDLRTPLQALSQGAEFLMRAAADPGLVQLGSRMFNSTDRMSAILNNLLDFTKSRTGGIQLTPAQADLGALTEQVVEEFRFSHPARTIRLNVHGNLSGQFDHARLGQVVQNLLSNALQYGSQEHPVTVSLSGEDAQLALSVHNHGNPIAAAAKEKIFDPLHRYTGQSEDSPASRNLGLGLFIIKEIVAAHAGTVDVDSSALEGTTFTVRLPRTGIAA